MKIKIKRSTARAALHCLVILIVFAISWAGKKWGVMEMTIFTIAPIAYFIGYKLGFRDAEKIFNWSGFNKKTCQYRTIVTDDLSESMEKYGITPDEMERKINNGEIRV
jgi:hypothetical protein